MKPTHTVLKTTAALVAAVVVFLLATLPPAPERLALDGVDPGLRGRTVAGAYHVHTTRSDGADGKALVAAAAARAGLAFVIFADHGDATRPPDPPTYVDGVLCVDAVEISTNGGHYVALGLGAAPYPLGGEAVAVVEDVERLGGFGIAGHPDHPNAELSWADWALPVDGIEWINADAEWRTESPFAIGRVLFDYLLRPAPAIASVLDRPERTLERWDAMSRTRRVVALAAVDAHGAARTGSPGEPRVAVGPSYEASFRTLTNRVVLDRPLSGNPGVDAGLLLAAVREGSVYSVVDAVSPDAIVRLDPGGPQLESPSPRDGRVTTLTDDGRRRIEVLAGRAPGQPPVPWILTNWIGSQPERPTPTPAPTPDGEVPALGSWRVEKDQASEGEVAQGETITLRYRLGGEPRRNQYAAVAADFTSARPFDRIAFRAIADRPMRLSVQLRFGPDDRRWTRSVYLDREPREVVIQVGELVAAEAPRDRAPGGRAPRSLLFVVDLVNSFPGTAGEFSVGNLRVTGVR